MRSRRIVKLQALVSGESQCLKQKNAIPARPGIGECISTSTILRPARLRWYVKVSRKGRRIGIREEYGTLSVRRGLRSSRRSAREE